MSISAFGAFLVVPPLNCLAAACLGAVLHRRRFGRALLAIGLAGLVVFAMPLVSGTLLSSLERGLVTTPPAGDMPGAIVILSGDEADILQGGRATTMVGHLTLERERAGALLARRTSLPVLVTGGVVDPGDPTLAAIMAQSLQQDFGVVATWKEEKSKDTWENAAMSAAILRKRRHSFGLCRHPCLAYAPRADRLSAPRDWRPPRRRSRWTSRRIWPGTL